MPIAKTPPMSRAEIAALIGKDLARVEKAIGTDTICSVEAVTTICHHLQMSGGKRLRPSLLLLTAGACGYQGDSTIRLGAVVEIIHAATLVHDDVIDQAEVRRGRPSINRRWGNHTSVLAGDWLYMRAFNLALKERSFYILDLLIDLTQMMVEGELMQMEWVGRLDVSEQEHLDLIHRKPACLFSVCSRLGAVVAEVEPEQEQRFGDYGWNLGVAFQLIDEVLDFTATEEILGKPVGNDLREGKVTLPTILALKKCTPAERQLVETVVRESAYESVPLSAIQELLDKYGTIKAVRSRALKYAETAASQLQDLPESPCKRALLSVTEMVVDRES
jgi:octaprenyl-diphosphate synthase